MTKRRLLLALVAVVSFAAGLVAALGLRAPREEAGRLDTELAGVSVERPPPRRVEPPLVTTAAAPPTARPAAERPCWPFFGGDAQRSLARTDLDLGPPSKPVWARGLGGYIEFPPTYCQGILYVNTFRGVTFAVDADTGRVLWSRRGGRKPSSPAIAGRRLIVSANDGTLTAFDRFTGTQLWRLHVGSRIESSPVVVDGLAYVGAADGRVFAVRAGSGRVRWAYRTGGLINSSPSVAANRVCVTTYAGSIFCLDRRNGRKLWSRYVRRDAVRYESFYASPSTDGRRLYTIARSGKIVALSARSGRVLWTRSLRGYGYSTPAIAGGRVFVGGFDGALHALDARTGRPVWRCHVGGRILGAPVVLGRLVFFATLEQRTYAARISDGRIVWRIGMGKYSPAIATSRRYYMSLNGILVAFHGRDGPPG